MSSMGGQGVSELFIQTQIHHSFSIHLSLLLWCRRKHETYDAGARSRRHRRPCTPKRHIQNLVLIIVWGVYPHRVWGGARVAAASPPPRLLLLLFRPMECCCCCCLKSPTLHFLEIRACCLACCTNQSIAFSLILPNYSAPSPFLQAPQDAQIQQ